MEASEDTIKRLRAYIRELQDTVDLGGSDEKLASRRKNIDNQKWAELGWAVVRAYDSLAAEGDHPPTELPDKFLSARVLYSTRPLCPRNTTICPWDRMRRRPTRHQGGIVPGKQLCPRGHNPRPPVCPPHTLYTIIGERLTRH